jgi:YfiR/HmsC-like
VGIALVAMLIPGGAPSFARGEPAPEYAVKAAFLYNIAKFVEWPADAFAGPASPIVFFVFGEDPFGDALKSLKGKTANGRPIVVRYAANLGELERCHLLFVSASEKSRLPKILQATKDWNVLTVGDVDGFARDGGTINLVNEEQRIGIEVNMEAAQRTRLQISSKLLGLAKIVKPARRPRE